MTQAPLAPCGSDHVIFSHTTKQDSQPTTYLISKQVVLYRTWGGTCYDGVSTPKTWSLADLGMTNHNTKQIPTISTILTNAKTIASKSSAPNDIDQKQAIANQ
jgi:hypothetical protein